jgi:UDP-N-acetylglucosamine 1-carboxyvinyltransferase
VEHSYLVVEQSPHLQGTVGLLGAKNAVLVIMTSLLLTEGKSRLKNVPFSEDVIQMIALLRDLGAVITCNKDEHTVEVDTTSVSRYDVNAALAQKTRASILVMGPLLSRFGNVRIGFPGGDAIGARPIDYHLATFKKMGAEIDVQGNCITARAHGLKAGTYALDYPSVGATENIMMAAIRAQGTTRIINAALEPEVLDLVTVLERMGARIMIHPCATIEIEGVQTLKPIEHTVMYDRLETGTILLAVAASGGSVHLPSAPACSLELFLMKLQEMGHSLEVGANGMGVFLQATAHPRAVSLKTTPYPGFPTDLQAPMMAMLSCVDGVSVVEETVFENRLNHVAQLQKMGASMKIDHRKVTIEGVDQLKAAMVEAHDIRTSSALVIAGLMAEGTTIVSGLHHWQRGYENLDKKLMHLGAKISCQPHSQLKNFHSAQQAPL